MTFQTTAIERSALETIKRLGGDKLLKQMIEIFLDVIPEKLESVWKGYQDKDYASIEKAAHSMRSTAGNLGAVQVQKTAEKVELMVMDHQYSALDSALQELDGAIVQACSAFETIKKEFEDEESCSGGR